jgi:hypothetical protein
MKLANFVTKLQNVLRPKQEETETISIQKGKRLSIPANDVERIYRHHRKRVVRVTYTGPKKLTCQNCGVPFYRLQTAAAAILSTTPMRVSKKRTGNGKRNEKEAAEES